jgi:Flp pilus assembly pilin Flp
MKALVARFLRDESGAGGLSQALLLAGTALIIIPTVEIVGNRLSAVFATLIKALR